MLHWRKWVDIDQTPWCPFHGAHGLHCHWMDHHSPASTLECTATVGRDLQWSFSPASNHWDIYVSLAALKILRLSKFPPGKPTWFTFPPLFTWITWLYPADIAEQPDIHLMAKAQEIFTTKLHLTTVWTIWHEESIFNVFHPHLLLQSPFFSHSWNLNVCSKSTPKGCSSLATGKFFIYFVISG